MPTATAAASQALRVANHLSWPTSAQRAGCCYTSRDPPPGAGRAGAPTWPPSPVEEGTAIVHTVVLTLTSSAAEWRLGWGRSRRLPTRAAAPQGGGPRARAAPPTGASSGPGRGGGGGRKALVAGPLNKNFFCGCPSCKNSNSNKYIVINWDNIQAGKKRNFHKCRSCPQ